jgi:hypothetical protein
VRQVLILILALLVLSCAASHPPATAPDLTGVALDGQSVSGPHYIVWADGHLAWDDVSQALSFVPSRTSETFYNVWSLLNPPHCVDCVKINVVQHDPVAKTLVAEVTLRNPTKLSGYFVRGVVDPPQGSGIVLHDPDDWWHSALQPTDDPPAPFMAFAKDAYRMEFKPGEIHKATYAFSYGSLSEFGACTYRVIARFPMEPGEVLSLSNALTDGSLTKLGGFLTLSIDMQTEATSPNVDLFRQMRFPGEPSPKWSTMRWEAGASYVAWFPGHATLADSAEIWIKAEMESAGDNYLAYWVGLEIQDVTPQPLRDFPPVGDGPSVFVDQLTTQMTDAQKAFMATHAVGSQKLVKTLADSMRSYNPDFIVVQYHLAFGAGDISNIDGNDWVSNWTFENAQEDFFEHRSWSTQPNQRVLQQDWNWYLTDPTGDWALYFIGNTLDRMDPLGEQFDGVFADSASQPWNTDPAKWWEGSDDPHDMFTYWTPKTQQFFDTVAAAYHTLPTYYYLIPNAGSYVTTISDITYDQCDGVMIEGFSHWDAGSYFDEVDWRLQMSRIRDLAIKDKIILCQTGVEVDNTVDRLFVLGSYMLIKDNYTYLNMLGPWGLEPQWWPEYSWNPGPAVEDWTTIDELQDPDGCYVRHFDNGIVIVNPSDETRYYTTTKMYSHTMYASGGLLPEDGVPTGVATGPIVGAGVQEIPPHSCWLGQG